MWCVKCESELYDCSCPDLEKRLDGAVGSGHFAYKACKKCKKHYARCKCVEPDFAIRIKE